MTKKSQRPTADYEPPVVEPVRVDTSGQAGRGHGSYTESHPSYGMVRVSRRHGTQRVFGCPIECADTITLEIFHGVVNRDLNQAWYHARDEIIEIVMSPVQFAELITNMNNGSGIPCTLQRVNGETLPDCPQIHDRELIEDEFQESMRKCMADLKELTATARAIIDNKAKKTLTNDDRAALGAVFDRFHRFTVDTTPFIHSQFNEAMDKTVNAAKAEYVAAIQMIAHSFGIEAMAQQFAGQALGSGAIPVPPSLPAARTAGDTDEIADADVVPPE